MSTNRPTERQAREHPVPCRGLHNTPRPMTWDVGAYCDDCRAAQQAPHPAGTSLLAERPARMIQVGQLYRFETLDGDHRYVQVAAKRHEDLGVNVWGYWHDTLDGPGELGFGLLDPAQTVTEITAAQAVAS
jgi:hypothetical protein